MAAALSRPRPEVGGNVGRIAIRLIKVDILRSQNNPAAVAYFIKLPPSSFRGKFSSNFGK